MKEIAPFNITIVLKKIVTEPTLKVTGAYYIDTNHLESIDSIEQPEYLNNIQDISWVDELYYDGKSLTEYIEPIIEERLKEISIDLKYNR